MLINKIVNFSLVILFKIIKFLFNLNLQVERELHLLIFPNLVDHPRVTWKCPLKCDQV